MSRLLPPEDPDNRIVVVSLTEDNLRKLKEPIVSDRTLVDLIKKIKEGQPAVIGLDFIRDLPVPRTSLTPKENRQSNEELLKLFQDKNIPLIGVEKVPSGSSTTYIAPPPNIPLTQRSAVNAPSDGDGVHRRSFLYVWLKEKEKQKEIVLRSLNLAVALSYLEKQGIKEQPGQNNWLKLKSALFQPIDSYSGGYIRAQAGFYQILINYRRPLDQSFDEIHFSEVLSKLPDYQFFKKIESDDVLKKDFDPDNLKDKIVLIGSVADSSNDLFVTPFSKDSKQLNHFYTYGVHYHAHICSQIISAVLDERALIHSLNKYFLPTWVPFPEEIVEVLLIFIFSGIPCFFGWRQYRREKEKENKKFFWVVMASGVTSAIVLWGVSYGFFAASGLWIPIVPAFLGSAVSSIVIIGLIYDRHSQDLNLNLEAKVQTQTKELKITLEELARKEKSAALGYLASGMAHAMKNPVYIVLANLRGIKRASSQLNETVETMKLEEFYYGEFLEQLFDNEEEFLTRMTNNIEEAYEETVRLDCMLQEVLENGRMSNSETKIVSCSISKLIDKSFEQIAKEGRDRYPDLVVEVKTKYDPTITSIEIISQDIESSLIALGENAYYSLNQKQKKREQTISSDELKEGWKPTIWLETQNKDSALEIKIKDNGTGIEETQLKQIFIPFNTNKPSGEGTGIGLFYARFNIENNHKGAISVESTLGEYTEFSIILPKKFHCI